MADYQLEQLAGKTPLQFARKPNLDFLASHGEVGLVRTIPEGMSPGSDVANLSVMGYDPRRYYTGRAPLEAVSMGIELSDNDIALRCNLVTLSSEEDYASKTMLDYSSDEISTEEAHKLIEAVQKELGSEIFSFHAGVSYRNCMVWKNGPTGLNLTPPHDISNRKIRDYLPKGQYGDLLLKLMVKSCQILRDHPVNRARISKGLRPANSIWLWGEGRRLSLPDFTRLFGLKGSVISAVDLVRGIGICAGFKPVYVEGATGNITTNFAGKARAALRELELGQDLAYIHVEAPDECAHRREVENKVRSIEMIDEKVLGILLEGLEKYDDYGIMVLPDHPTSSISGTHTKDPVPFVIYKKSRRRASGAKSYDEAEAENAGLLIPDGPSLMERFIGRKPASC